MIDEKLSGLLFGSTKIQGKSLMIDGRPYEILGVLPGSSGTALIQADRDTKAVMNRVTLHITGKESRQEAVRRFSGSTGIQGTLPVSYTHLCYAILIHVKRPVLQGSIERKDR